jgi:hypothetical protein
MLPGFRPSENREPRDLQQFSKLFCNQSTVNGLDARGDKRQAFLSILGTRCGSSAPLYSCGKFLSGSVLA